jgi:uncharacterized protein YukE
MCGLRRPARMKFRNPSIAEWQRFCDSALQQLTKENDMAQAIMDPEKVRRFAEELQRFNSDIENRLILLHTRFAALGDTWSDQEHEKFSEEFKTAMKALKKFVELSKEHTPFLLRKAQRIEEYLNQR